MARIESAWLAGMLLVTTAMVAAAQAPEASQAVAAPIERQEAPYRISVTAREVVLDVVVTDAKGHSVTGLKASDFTVREDGFAQTVRGLSEHRAMTGEEVARLSGPEKLPPNLFTNSTLVGNTNAVNVILIDALDTPAVGQMYLRQQVIAFMKTVPPGHPFAIFQMDTEMHLVQGFTSDPAVLLHAVESKRYYPELQPLLSEYNRPLRQEVVQQGLAGMGRYLAAFPGRKNLIWFTAEVPHTVYGLTRNPFPDAIDFDIRTERAANAQSLSRIAVYPIDVCGLGGCPSAPYHPTGQDFGAGDYYGEGARYGGRLAPVYGHEELERVASATGGKAVWNDNGLKDVLQEIVATGSDYYTVAYAPTNPAWNAHSRHIELSVNRKGVELLYRHTYYGRKERKPQRNADLNVVQSTEYVAAAGTTKTLIPDATPHATPDAAAGAQAAPMSFVTKPDFDEAMELGAMPSGELLFDVSIAPATTVTKLNKGEPLPPNDFMRDDLQSKPYRLYRLRYTVDPNKVGFTGGSGGVRHGQLQYVAVVYDAEGAVVNSLVSSTQLAMDDAMFAEAMGGGKSIGTRQEIAVPEKGSYFLRVGVHDEVGDLVGSIEVPLDGVQRDVAGPGQTLAP
jgi:VWFA-related protein